MLAEVFADFAAVIRDRLLKSGVVRSTRAEDLEVEAKAFKQVVTD